MDEFMMFLSFEFSLWKCGTRLRVCARRQQGWLWRAARRARRGAVRARVGAGFAAGRRKGRAVLGKIQGREAACGLLAQANAERAAK